MKMKILGSGQDGGIPHTGCFCDLCILARKDHRYRRLGPSVAIADLDDDLCFLVDASPDFKIQLDTVIEENLKTKRGGKIPLDGILLTHSHFGHIGGLWHLGREVLEENELPIYATRKIHQFFQENYPFNLLIKNRNVRIEEIESQKMFELDGVKVLPIKVPHRDEIGDTVAYVIESKRRVLYMPDLDKWTPTLLEMVRNCEVALIDGTFHSRKEVSGFENTPHPPILETVRLLEGADAEIVFVHINHTNPVNRNGTERKHLENKGFKIAFDGMEIPI
ncbi:MAG: MBL fold metallo-hydrolase [Candidatus Bathyarchaeota archaeon]|jgi:pyrroloquinoline quinone biosynthesis protein B